MRTAALVCLGLLVAGCAATREGPGVGADKLYEAVAISTSQYVAVIDSRTHSIDRRLPLGVPTNDWKHLYSIVSSSLLDTDPQTGATLNTMALGDAYELPAATSTGLPGGLSPMGRWLVVQSFDGSATHMLVIDTIAFKVTDRIDLTGRFHFDAISDDGQRVYLIQYLNGKEYYVRQYDVGPNQLDATIVVDKSDGSQAMTGLRLSGVWTPDGSMLFSMYVRENEGPFIHALNLGGPFAFCIDLPGAGYARSQSAMRWSLAMRRDGTRLYAVNGATGVVAEIDTSNQHSPQILRTAQTSDAVSGANGAGAAVITPDGKTLVAAGSAGLVWLDTSTLKPRMTSLSGRHVSSLALSPDGKILFAVADKGEIAELAMASGQVTGQFDPTEGTPLALMRVAAV